MGWFQNLFTKKEQITITIDQLPDWFRQETRGKLDRLENEIQELKQEIKKEGEELLSSAEKLEQAQLKNENIEEKAKQYMTGNRDNYLKQLRFFVKQIIYEKEPREFCKSLQEQLTSFNKASARSYAILQEFFADEAREIAFHVGKIDKLTKKIEDSVNDPDLKDINQTKDLINELFKQIELNKNREKDIEELKQQIQEAVKQKEEIEKILESLKKSEEYKEYHELKQRIQEAEQKKAKVLDEITQTFSPLMKAMKKYQRLAFQNNDILELYTTDLYKALNIDTKWDIILVFQNIERMLKDNALELKEGKQDKIREQIAKIDKPLLDSFKQKVNLAMLEKTGAEEHLKSNQAMEKLESIELKLSNANTRINTLTVRMNTETHELEAPTIENIKEKLIKQLVSVSGKGVTLQ